MWLVFGLPMSSLATVAQVTCLWVIDQDGGLVHAPHLRVGDGALVAAWGLGEERGGQRG